MSEQKAEYFYRFSQRIHESDLPLASKYQQLFDWMSKLFLQVTLNEKLNFTTMFARIAYACHREKVSREVQIQVHHFRKRFFDVQFKNQSLQDIDYDRGFLAFNHIIQALLHEDIPVGIQVQLPNPNIFDNTGYVLSNKLELTRVYTLHVDRQQRLIRAQDESRVDGEIFIRFAQTGLNEVFDDTIERLVNVYQHQAVLNLIDVDIDAEGIYHPRVMVLEPDYLMDISAIAENHQHSMPSSVNYVLKKFLPFESTKAIMVGNIANFILDELMHDIERRYEDIFPQVFKMSPIAFALMDDGEVMDIYRTCGVHYSRLKKVLLLDFPSREIKVENCSLEPSFYAERYGIQGRLDVWYKNPDSPKSAIVELKSGKIFNPNKFGLNNNHYTQTLLYDLLVRSVFGQGVDPSTHILYSSADFDQLKYAPPLEMQQMEAIQVRNQLVSADYQLAQMDQDGLDAYTFLDSIRPGNYPRAGKFQARDLGLFADTMMKATSLERKYFMAFTAFIAREHLLAKTGESATDVRGGLADLWLKAKQTKLEDYELITGLTLVNNEAGHENPRLFFKRTDEASSLANFREGDIAILYPQTKEADTVLHNQIFKGTIEQLSQDTLVFKLRSRQFNLALFDQAISWSMEHDMMEHGYNAQYKGLFAFLGADPAAKRLLLGLDVPKQSKTLNFDFKAYTQYVSEEQQRILNKAIAVEDYFLLVGPPGTGKTKYMLANFVRYILEQTQEQILLLSYTNRAVDEICDAIHDFAEGQYIRIGSESSTDSRFTNTLFNKRLEQIGKRKDLKQLIDQTRVFVTTVSSMQGRLDLLQLKQFDRVLIDEASQILEPMLVGLLPHFKRFVLIGDHKQLPAVVQQNSQKSKIHDEALNAIGLTDRRNSLFERLYNRAVREGWTWAYDMLTRQGRMHADIMAYPNAAFYEGNLRLITDAEDEWQRYPLALDNPNPEDTRMQELCTRRLLFIPTPADELGNHKTNIHEAQLCAELALMFKEIYAHNNEHFNPESIGIITPYRAQIASIRKALNHLVPELEQCTVDTVERYQGGARDIIIISLCLNNIKQLDSLVSLSDDGKVDRKLNVAMTRARQHLIILGNPEIMSQSDIYKSLLAFIYQN
jgi:DNA replication ATP-dependent helicase Dna2